MRTFIYAAMAAAVLTFSCAAQPRQFELKAESPKFWELFAEDAKLDKIATGFGFTEGPVWDPKGFLYVSCSSRISGGVP